MRKIFTKEKKRTAVRIQKTVTTGHEPYLLRDRHRLFRLQNTVFFRVCGMLIKTRKALEHEANPIKLYKVKSFKRITN